jgi:hypothetical protein
VKDNTTTKLVFAIAVFAAVSFAIWTGIATPVEQATQTVHSGAYTTPF